MSLEVDIYKKLKGFDLSVSFSLDGEVAGILGASGDGKSLTLKCIAGIEKPDAGRIVLNGRVLFDSQQKINLKPQERNVGYLFQNYALFPHMRVAENILCSMKVTGAAKEERLQQLLKMFQLEGLEKRYPLQLSGGQQQRVALARMLAYEPEIILLDEPFSALDAYLKEQLEVELRQILQRYEKDAIIVTHSRDEVYRLCPQLMVIEKGKMLQKGATKELFKAPSFLVTARLSGCKNFSRIRQIDSSHVAALDWDETVLEVPAGLTDQIDYIGIRAHYFTPSEICGENCLPVHAFEQIEDPFEWNVMFYADENQKSEPIWWKQSKGSGTFKVPNFLKVDPKNILLLASKGREEKHEGK